jgi:glucan biosynthesis protein C
MQSSDRLHALDAVRAFALLLGVALHAAHPYVAGLPWVTTEPPSATVAGLWYTVHLFRMPLFFLIAGFFGRMMLERRGTAGFIKDRSRRILLPLVAGVPTIMLITGVCYVLGALVAGQDPRGLHPPAAPPAPHGIVASINLIHLWFLYYLLLFYAAALSVRCAFGALDRGGHLQVRVDATVRFLMRGAWGPLFLALPSIVFYSQLKGWSVWGGLPAPFSLIPDVGALIGYGVFFGFGWLLHRQPPVLLCLQKRWPLYGMLAAIAWIGCRLLAGSSPHWGPFLKGGALLAYTTAYVVGSWCVSLGLMGVAIRFLSGYSPVRRYLADSSYWIYLLHIPVLFFFSQALHPLHWHWSLKYPVTIACAMTVLLLSYHLLVRFTFIGATLNGRRAISSSTTPHPHSGRSAPGCAT